jgi:hypothetical protein
MERMVRKVDRKTRGKKERGKEERRERRKEN